MGGCWWGVQILGLAGFGEASASRREDSMDQASRSQSAGQMAPEAGRRQGLSHALPSTRTHGPPWSSQRLMQKLSVGHRWSLCTSQAGTTGGSLRDAAQGGLGHLCSPSRRDPSSLLCTGVGLGGAGDPPTLCPSCKAPYSPCPSPPETLPASPPSSQLTPTASKASSSLPSGPAGGFSCFH